MKASLQHILPRLATAETAGAVVVLLTCVVGGIGGCRKPSPASPAPRPPTLEAPASEFIADRRTHVYHRPNCPHLPPPERRVRLDGRMLELTASLHKPCEVCKPAAVSAQQGPQPMPQPSPQPSPPPPPGEDDAVR